MKLLLPIFSLCLCLLFTACQPNPASAAEEEVAADNAKVTTASDTVPLDQTTMAPPIPEFTIQLPADVKLIGEAQGDLDQDGAEEHVLVVEPLPENEDLEQAPPRRVQVYHQIEGQWKLWQEIPGGVLPADAGGMLGDPFQGLTIERGAIVVDHFGGSRIRWNYTHRFRWQNGQWQLIGATIVYGAPCDYWHIYDYNLSVGKIEAKWETEDCDADESTAETFSFQHHISPLPEMSNFVPGDLAVPVPERDAEVYF